jgi:hypothetical protein
VVYYLGIETEEERKMKHKHYDVGVAKLENTELCVFYKLGGSSKWESTLKTSPQHCFYEQNDYFLCLPQHKEAVLHSLNGGEAVSDSGDGDWCLSSTELWRKDWWYMCESYESKVKPKKEKRWIGYCASRNQTFPHPQGSKELAWDYAARNYSYHTSEWQVIEIEVEV